MIRLIMLNGSNRFRDDSVNLKLQTFDVENSALEKLVKETTSSDTEITLVGIEIVDKPAPPPLPITQPNIPVIEANTKTPEQLKAELQAKHRPTLSQRLADFWHGKPKEKVINLPG